MKNLAEVLDQLPATTEPSSTALDLSEQDIEGYLLHITQQAQARRAAQAMDAQMIFRFCCVGLAGGLLLVAAFIAWLYRPINAMAQADAVREMSSAMALMASEVAAAKPQQIRCPVVGSCRVEDAPVQPAASRSIPLTPLPAAEEVDRAKQVIHQWVTAGSDSVGIRQFIGQVQSGQVNSPELPAPQALEIAYVQYFGVTH